jgi:hypothetical protein
MCEHVANLPVVAISGITALDFVNASPEPRDVICLLKPFRPNELIRAVEAAQRAPWPPAAVAASENRGAFRERARSGKVATGFPNRSCSDKREDRDPLHRITI